MKHTVSRTLYSYWTKLRGSRTAPDRRDIEPSEIRHILGDTFILEVQDDANYVFRLAGTRICAALGREMKGRNLLSLWKGEDSEAMRSLLLAIVEDGAAAVVGLNSANDRQQGVPLEMVLLPLTHQGGGFTRILGCLVPMEMPYWLGVHPLMDQTITSLRIIWPDERPHFLQPDRPVMAPAFGNFAERIVVGDDEAQSAPSRPSGPQIPSLSARANRIAYDRAGPTRAPEWSRPVPPSALSRETAGRRVGHLTVIDGGRL